MDIEQPVKEWESMITPALESKAYEFMLAGYSGVSVQDIWTCLEEKVWKGSPRKRLYEVVQDILHLDGSVYMSYLTLDVYQENDDFIDSIAALYERTEKEKRAR